ncbi:MAG TPA: 23S rRNA (pseudouridine(1915)-N(3))-methyltransferase RlmH [Longimicrobiales bacterium]
MRLLVVCVGQPGRLLADAIGEYERRAGRYWSLTTAEVREEKAGKGKAEAQVRRAESRRLLDRVPAGFEVVALTRGGEAWSSTRLARYLERFTPTARPGVAFLIGGAFGIDDDALGRADRRLSLSPLTLPHDLARLVLAEQLYRAGTIVRGEPYHKATE